MVFLKVRPSLRGTSEIKPSPKGGLKNVIPLGWFPWEILCVGHFSNKPPSMQVISHVKPSLRSSLKSEALPGGSFKSETLLRGSFNSETILKVKYSPQTKGDPPCEVVSKFKMEISGHTFSAGVFWDTQTYHCLILSPRPSRNCIEEYFDTAISVDHTREAVLVPVNKLEINSTFLPSPTVFPLLVVPQANTH